MKRIKLLIILFSFLFLIWSYISDAAFVFNIHDTYYVISYFIAGIIMLGLIIAFLGIKYLINQYRSR